MALEHRRPQPEILDSLPPEDPRARASRSDLRWLNVLMGNIRWIRRELELLLLERQGPLRVLELGAGDGALPRALPRRWRRRVRWTGMDRLGWPASPELAGWTMGIQGDIRTLRWPEAEVVVANLVLHHFDDATLGLLASKVPASAHTILLCEPARCRRAILGLMLLRGWFIHPVTWHDGVLSVGAGFRRGELPELFVLPPSWKWKESEGWAGTLRAVVKRAGPR